MTSRPPELEEAARTLLQWARARQTTWRDPSADLMAALGNRYQHLEDAAPVAHVPGTPALPPTMAAVAPSVQAAASTASTGHVGPGVEAPPPLMPPPVAPPPPPAISTAPVPTPNASPRTAGTFATTRESGFETTRSAAGASAAPRPRASRAWMPWAAAAAALIVVAVVAAPKVWHSYAPAALVAPKPGVLALASAPSESTVIIDGVESGSTPLQKELPPGVHTVEFRSKKSSRTIEVTVVAGETVTGAVDWSRKPVGRLQVTSDVSKTKVLVDGKPRGTAPLTIENLTPGAHVVTLQSAQGSVKQTITVKEGATAELAGSIYPGSLHVSAPFEVQLSESGQLLRLDDGNQVVLSPGPHKIRIVGTTHGFSEERAVDIQPGKLTSIQLTQAAATSPAAPPSSANPSAAEAPATPASAEPPAAAPAAAPPTVPGEPPVDPAAVTPR